MPDKTAPSLLLLPPPPKPATAAAIKEAYSQPLAGALTTLQSLHSVEAPVLDLVVPCPGTVIHRDQTCSFTYTDVEGLIARVYSLVCLVCAQKAIDTEGPGGVDVRVLILSLQGDEEHTRPDSLPSLQPVSGPIIDLSTLALTRRTWRYIFKVESEQGFELYTKYQNLARLSSPPISSQVEIVGGGISMIASKSTITSQPVKPASTKHSVAAVGGTFDHLHSGHKLLLTATALTLQPTSPLDNTPRRLIVGITGDELLKNKKFAECLQSWKARQSAVVAFLIDILSFTRSRAGADEIETRVFNEPVVNGKAIHTHLKSAAVTIECVEIQDPFGPTITDESITALVVSGETRSGGAAVNRKREEQGWQPLQVFEVDVLDAGDDNSTDSSAGNFESKISSTAIRKRIVERNLV